jgi:putative methyltransferase (TIGR04325 family)
VIFGNSRDWPLLKLIRFGVNWFGLGIRFKGNYSSWDAAQTEAEGYDAELILKRVLRATLAVKAGQAAFERDGVPFAKPDYPFPLLAGLMRVAALDGGRLNVLDFGGALGSTYFQCRPWLKGLPSLKWLVVEQPHFVACGRAQIADGTLEFVEQIEDCIGEGRPNVAILSSVLQYVPKPDDVLQRIAALGVRHVIVDRTPVIEAEHDIIAVQVVPSRIVRSKYPVRLFSRRGFLARMERDYRLIASFQALDGVLGDLFRRVEFKGFIFERRP